MKLRVVLVLIMISCAFGVAASGSTDPSDQRRSDSPQSEVELRARVSGHHSNQHNHVLTNQSIRRTQTMQRPVMSSTLRSPAAARDKTSRSNTEAAPPGFGSMRHRGSNPPIIGGPINGTSRGASISGTNFKRTEVLKR